MALDANAAAWAQAIGGGLAFAATVWIAFLQGVGAQSARSEEQAATAADLRGRLVALTALCSALRRALNQTRDRAGIEMIVRSSTSSLTRQVERLVEAAPTYARVEPLLGASDMALGMASSVEGLLATALQSKDISQHLPSMLATLAGAEEHFSDAARWTAAVANLAARRRTFWGRRRTRPLHCAQAELQRIKAELGNRPDAA